MQIKRPTYATLGLIERDMGLDDWNEEWDAWARGGWVVTALAFGFEGRGIDPRLRSPLRRSIASVACVYDWNKAPLTVEADNNLTRHWQESYTKRSNGMAQCGGLHGLSENQMPHSCSSRPGRLPRLTTTTTHQFVWVHPKGWRKRVRSWHWLGNCQAPSTNDDCHESLPPLRLIESKENISRRSV